MAAAGVRRGNVARAVTLCRLSAPNFPRVRQSKSAAPLHACIRAGLRAQNEHSICQKASKQEDCAYPVPKIEANVQIRPFSKQDEEVVISLWEQCGLTRPWNDPRKDIARKSRIDPELFIVAIEDDEVIGSAMGGYEGHRGWINYLAVRRDFLRRGVARALMQRLEEELKSRGCPKINVQVRYSNIVAADFYKALGYEFDEVVSMGKRLDPDN